MPPNLMTLPFELRQMIIRDAITLSREPPRWPPANIDRELLPLIGTAIYVERNPDTAPAKAQASLLCTSRQLRSETQRALASLRGRPHILDLMIVLDCGLFPTWCHVPGLHKSVDLVTVRIRILDPPENFPKSWKWRVAVPGVWPSKSLQVLLAQYVPRTCLHGHTAATPGFAPCDKFDSLCEEWASNCEWALIHRLSVVVAKPASLPAKQAGVWGSSLLRGRDRRPRIRAHESRTSLADSVAESMRRVIEDMVRWERGVCQRYLMANVWEMGTWREGRPEDASWEGKPFRVGEVFRANYSIDKDDVPPAIVPSSHGAKVEVCKGWNHRCVERWRREGLWREQEEEERGSEGDGEPVASPSSLTARCLNCARTALVCERSPRPGLEVSMYPRAACPSRLP